MVEKTGEMIFRSGPKDQVIKSPKELAVNGIWVHPNVMDRTWGAGASEIYNRARMDGSKVSITVGNGLPKADFDPGTESAIVGSKGVLTPT